MHDRKAVRSWTMRVGTDVAGTKPWDSDASSVSRSAPPRDFRPVEETLALKRRAELRFERHCVKHPAMPVISDDKEVRSHHADGTEYTYVVERMLCPQGHFSTQVFQGEEKPAWNVYDRETGLVVWTVIDHEAAPADVAPEYVGTFEEFTVEQAEEMGKRFPELAEAFLSLVRVA